MKQSFLYETDFGICSEVITINGRLSWLLQREEMEAAWNCFHCTPGCHCTLLENYCAMTSYMIRVFRHGDADRMKCTWAFRRTISFWLLNERSRFFWRLRGSDVERMGFFPFSLEKSWAPVWINCTQAQREKRSKVVFPQRKLWKIWEGYGWLKFPEVKICLK